MKTKMNKGLSLLLTVVISLMILSSSCSPRTHQRIRISVPSNNSLQASAHLYKENWSHQDRYRYNMYSSKYADSKAYQKRKADEKKAFKHWLITIAGCFGILKLLTN